MHKILLSIFHGKEEVEAGQRIEPTLFFGPSKNPLHRRCCCIASDELLNVPTSEPVFRISPEDTDEDIKRGIAEYLRHLKDHRPGFRRYDEDDLRWLVRLESRED